MAEPLQSLGLIHRTFSVEVTCTTNNTLVADQPDCHLICLRTALAPLVMTSRPASHDFRHNRKSSKSMTHISGRRLESVRAWLVTSLWASCPSRRAILAPPPSASIPHRGSPCWVALVCLIQRTSACSAAKASAVDLSSPACRSNQSNVDKYVYSRVGARMEY